MASIAKIKSFQFTRNYYQTSGIYTPQANHSYSLNAKVLLNVFLFAALVTASFAYLLFKANSIGESAYSYCMSITLLWCTLLMTADTLKIPNILQLIEKYDEFIHKRKSAAIIALFFVNYPTQITGSLNTESSKMTLKYAELIEKIERMTGIFYFSLAKVSVSGSFLPAFLITVVNYFIYDLGDKSFYLTVPVMYVPS